MPQTSLYRCKEVRDNARLYLGLLHNVIPQIILIDMVVQVNVLLKVLLGSLRTELSFRSDHEMKSLCGTSRQRLGDVKPFNSVVMHKKDTYMET